MRTRRGTTLWVLITAVAVSVAVAVYAVRGSAQGEQSQLAELLRNGNVSERAAALDAVLRMTPNSTPQELRFALYESLREEALRLVERYHAGRRGVQLEELQDPEFIARATRAVSRLDDPAAIPALSLALGHGFVAIRELVEFGEDAAPSVLAVASSPESTMGGVEHALITLRLMIENIGQKPLSEKTLAAIRAVARSRIQPDSEQGQSITTLWWAIDLASVLEDRELRSILQDISSDREFLTKMGIKDEELIRQTQKRASDRLSGLPPRPRS